MPIERYDGPGFFLAGQFAFTAPGRNSQAPAAPPAASAHRKPDARFTMPSAAAIYAERRRICEAVAAGTGADLEAGADDAEGIFSDAGAAAVYRGRRHA